MIKLRAVPVFEYEQLKPIIEATDRLLKARDGFLQNHAHDLSQLTLLALDELLRHISSLRVVLTEGITRLAEIRRDLDACPEMTMVELDREVRWLENARQVEMVWLRKKEKAEAKKAKRRREYRKMKLRRFSRRTPRR